MRDWEKRLVYPGGTKASFQAGTNTRYYKLIAQSAKNKILPQITIDGLGYNDETPGPLLVFKQGELIQIELVNNMDEPTSLHVHGLSKPVTQDGIPEIEPTPKLNPGESYLYQFPAWQAGTFFYHASNPLHITQGLLGPLVILPREENFAQSQQIPYRDYVLVLQQWQLPQPDIGKVYPGTFKPNKFDQNPNFFTINGKAFPDTEPLMTRRGEKVRIRFINKSSSSHSMHLHGHDFKIVEVNGFPRKNMYDDTINVASG